MDVALGSKEDPQGFLYSRAIAPWCYDAGDTMGTIANKNFWSCALDIWHENDTTQSLTLAKPG